ncbi:hypothetical protein CSV75_01840 [Sporosarcina sp. P18a]|nr:hypothetical protein CSV75_01840 [Sporosarcina sp. P18a]
MIDWLSRFLETDNTKLIYILALIMGANIIDFTLGWINAKFNKKVDFSSSRAIFGIARKMLLLILCVYFIPVALLAPYPIGISALYVLYIGYLLSEINSIFNHLRLTDDDKSTDVFIDFINTVFKKGGK